MIKELSLLNLINCIKKLNLNHIISKPEQDSYNLKMLKCIILEAP